jgi:hypothetical protein
MVAFNKFNAFVEAIAEKKINLETDTLKVMLTNTAPVAANSVKADLTEIGAGNGYTAGGATATVTSSSQTSGTYKLVLADVAFTASGGSIGPFRYAVLYSDTATNKDLIGFWDYGSSQTLNNGEKLDVDFDPSTGVLTNV